MSLLNCFKTLRFPCPSTCSHVINICVFSLHLRPSYQELLRWNMWSPNEEKNLKEMRCSFPWKHQAKWGLFLTAAVQATNSWSSCFVTFKYGDFWVRYQKSVLYSSYAECGVTVKNSVCCLLLLNARVISTGRMLCLYYLSGLPLVFIESLLWNLLFDDPECYYEVLWNGNDLLFQGNWLQLSETINSYIYELSTSHEWMEMIKDVNVFLITVFIINDPHLKWWVHKPTV